MQKHISALNVALASSIRFVWQEIDIFLSGKPGLSGWGASQEAYE
jgi:hypothetical protein